MGYIFLETPQNLHLSVRGHEKVVAIMLEKQIIPISRKMKDIDKINFLREDLKKTVKSDFVIKGR